MQAVCLRAKLNRLEKWNELRSRAAARYAELLDQLPGLRLLPPGDPGGNVWHLYVVRVADRERVLATLADGGVGVGVHYPTPVHLTPAYRHLGRGPGTAPVAEIAAGEILSLPMHPHLTEAMQERVTDLLRSCLTR